MWYYYCRKYVAAALDKLSNDVSDSKMSEVANTVRLFEMSKTVGRKTFVAFMATSGFSRTSLVRSSLCL